MGRTDGNSRRARRRRENRCPNSAKAAYRTADEARATCAMIAQRASGATSISGAYLCQCGFWHLTSKPVMNILSRA